MGEKQNINHIVEQKLCNTCGACFAVCNSSSIYFSETIGGNYFPGVNNITCTNCGLCLSVCPSVKMSKELSERMPNDPFIGKCIKTFVGKATDGEIYKNSQSGGLASAIILHSLEFYFADASIMVSMDCGSPPRPKVHLVRNKNEIISSQKSKYCPVPVLSGLKNIINSDHRIIFIGTACQVHGLFNILEIIPKLKNKISLIIGLICDRTMTNAALDYLIDKSKLSNTNSIEISLRDKLCGGYPGNVNIKSADGKKVVLSAKSRMHIKDYFTPLRCYICFDKMNVFSDIVVGDPHGIEGIDRVGGESVAIIRTHAGMNLFQSALKANVLIAREKSYADVLAGQKIKQKRTQWIGYVNAWHKLNFPMAVVDKKVYEYAFPFKENKKYIKNLKHAASLDMFISRQDLIRAAKKHVFFQNLKRIATYPYRVIQKIITQILS